MLIIKFVGHRPSEAGKSLSRVSIAQCLRWHGDLREFAMVTLSTFLSDLLQFHYWNAHNADALVRENAQVE